MGGLKPKNSSFAACSNLKFLGSDAAEIFKELRYVFVRVFEVKALWHFWDLFLFSF
jgi:hypothetical protein